MDLKAKIRNIKDFPKKGIVFRDITPLIGDGEALKYTIDVMADYYKDKKSMPSWVRKQGVLFSEPLLLTGLGPGLSP